MLVAIFSGHGDHHKTHLMSLQLNQKEVEIRGRGAGSAFEMQVLVGCSKVAQGREVPRQKPKNKMKHSPVK